MTVGKFVDMIVMKGMNQLYWGLKFFTCTVLIFLYKS